MFICFVGEGGLEVRWELRNEEHTFYGMGLAGDLARHSGELSFWGSKSSIDPWHWRFFVELDGLGKKVYGCQPKNRGILPPKWMVKIMENPIKMG